MPKNNIVDLLKLEDLNSTISNSRACPIGHSNISYTHIKLTDILVSKDINYRCLGFAISKASRRVTQFYDGEFRHLGIRSTQFNMMVALYDGSPTNLSHFSKIMQMDRTTLSRNLALLEKKKFVVEKERERDADGRVKRFSLTSKGLQTVRDGIPIWQAAQAKLESRLNLNDDINFHAIKLALDTLTERV